MTHSNTSATIGYLKKVFLLNLNRSSRLDTISLLKLSRTYQFYKNIHLIVHQMKECTVELKYIYKYEVDMESKVERAIASKEN